MQTVMETNTTELKDNVSDLKHISAPSNNSIELKTTPSNSSQLETISADNQASLISNVKQSIALISGVNALAANTLDRDLDPAEALDCIIDLSAISIETLTKLSTHLMELNIPH